MTFCVYVLADPCREVKGYQDNSLNRFSDLVSETRTLPILVRIAPRQALCAPAPKSQLYDITPAFVYKCVYGGAGDPNSGPHTRTAEACAVNHLHRRKQQPGLAHHT